MTGVAILKVVDAADAEGREPIVRVPGTVVKGALDAVV